MNTIDELGRKRKEAVVIYVVVLFHRLLERTAKSLKISGRMAGPQCKPLMRLLTAQPSQRSCG
jgi:hypothetical protein